MDRQTDTPKVIYLAHPIRDERGLWFHYQNIRKAEAVAAELTKMGFAVICPGKNNENFDGLVPDEEFLALDKEIMLRCDAVVMVPGWTQSVGAMAEWDMANAVGIPTFFWAKQEDRNALQQHSERLLQERQDGPNRF